MSPFWILLELMMMGVGTWGVNWSYKTCEAPVKSPTQSNQQSTFLQARCLSCRERHLKGNAICIIIIIIII